METVNRQQARELLGVSDRQLERYVAESKIQRVDKGAYSCKSINEFLVGKRVEFDSTDHKAVKLEQDRLKNKLMELQIDETEGRLVDVNAVTSQVSDMARKTRDAIINVIPRLTPILSAETDPHKIQVELSKELRASLGSLKQYLTD